jgi:hypothetical protein
MVSPLPIQIKFPSGQQHYVRILYTEFQTNRKINAENMDRKCSHSKVKQEGYCDDFQEIHNGLISF